MVEFVVERRKTVPGPVDTLFSADTYVVALGYVVDYVRGLGPHARLGQHALNDFYVATSEDGDYQTLRIKVGEQ
jgi:hypothetical protein